MKENIETKDVQRTEYLDKNGLDMLWAKVKEDTLNQVEVERNRATTQEDRIIETKADKSELHSSYVSNSTFTALQEKVAANTDAISDKQDAGNYLSYETLNDEGYYEIPDIRISGSGGNTKTNIDSQSISVKCDTPDGYTTITCDGISNNDNNANHVYATDGSIADLSQYIKIDDAYLGCIPYYSKYTESEIQRYQLTDKEGIELSSYDTTTKLLGSDIAISSGSEDLTLTQNEININSYGGTSNHFYVNVNSDPKLSLWSNQSAIVAKIDGNKQMAMIGIRETDYGETTYDLKLSADGIEMLSKTTKDIVTANNSTAHIGSDDDQTEYTYVAPLENGKVPAEYLDLSQYAKKSEITAGGNVDDVQVNGVSVIENKIANIKPATKESLGVVKVGDGLNVTDGTVSVDTTAIGAGNYIPYESIDDHINYKVYITKYNEGILFDAGSESISISRGEMNIKSPVRKLSLTSNFILLQEISDNGNRETLLVELDENGLRLRNGDNNHVLTSYGSTIDITQYAKKTELPTKVSQLQNDSEFITKSTYDEKIAALEARIAALEAKHTETA